MATDDMKTVLEVCEQVRTLLHQHGVPIPLDFPIIPMEQPGLVLDKHYLGCAHCTHEEWELVDKNHQTSSKKLIHKVELCFHDPETKQLYSMEQILQTILHEFAHCITPGCLVYEPLKGEKKKTWNFAEHDDSFYTNFSHILDVAEKLKIYKLHPSFSKNNKDSLRRFDSVDIKSFIGTSELFGTPTTKATTGPLKVNVKNDQGEAKLIILDGKEDWMLELAAGCMKKFPSFKKNTKLKFFTAKGDPIESSDVLIASTKETNLIVVRKVV